MKIKILILMLIVLAGSIAVAAQNGFDQYGYNDKARIFVGLADGVDRIWGNDPVYGNDHLVMKWTKAWDVCNDTGFCTPAAWTDNEWNGMVPGGSGETWHYKIVWVGDCGAYGTPLDDGGYCIWGAYEVIFSHGTVANEHFWDAHAIPAGYGGPLELSIPRNVLRTTLIC